MSWKGHIRLWFSELGLFPNLPPNYDTVKLRRVLAEQTERLEKSRFSFCDADNYNHSHLQWHWCAFWLVLRVHNVALIAHSFFIIYFTFFYFFWKDQCDIWQVFSSFFITKLLSVTPPTCSFCAPVYRMFSGWSIVDRWHWATSAKEFLYLRCAQYLQTWVKFCKGEWE